jgi:hypothetical protein
MLGLELLQNFGGTFSYNFGIELESSCLLGLALIQLFAVAGSLTFLRNVLFKLTGSMSKTIAP